jgi:glycosyltransferase involved in cell wall biosynthesis
MSDRVRLRRTLQRIHRSQPIDIVEWPDFEGLYLGPIPGITDVVRNHGPIMSHRLYGLTKHRPHTEWLERHTLRAIGNWIGVSTWFMKEWIRITGAKPQHTTVLYNPVDCDLFKPGGGRRDDLIVYSGSLLERKGVFALAKAARQFLPRLPGATLLFVGRDVTGDARTRIISEAGPDAAQQIQFSDPLPQGELADLFRRCTLFAMPSLLESFGNVWAEAMASGTPVLGSKLTCGPEVVPDGIAGILADPKDPQDIANHVVRLMNDSALRSRFGAAGRQIAIERYSTDVVIPKTVSFYHECLSIATLA